MSTGGRLGTFAAGIVVAFGLGAGAGVLLGPIDVGGGTTPTHVTHDDAHDGSPAPLGVHPSGDGG